jgi:DNA-binding NarL/FixJ family response regulator
VDQFVAEICDFLGSDSDRAPDGLTRREIEVLHLLARGLSNTQISDELVLSTRTVARHITNIYGKISVQNRSEATAYAIRHDLA